jgi:hypothetical protein
MYSTCTNAKLIPRRCWSPLDHVALRPGEIANFLEISPLYRQTVLGECQVKNGLIVAGANITVVSGLTLLGVVGIVSNTNLNTF